MEFRWLVTMFIINCVEVLAIQWFLHRRLGVRKHALLRGFIGFAVQLAALFLMTYYGLNDYIRTVAVTALAFLYALLACGSSLWAKVKQILVAFLLLAASGFLVAAVLPLSTGARFSDLSALAPIRFEMRIASRILFFGMMYFVGRKPDQSDALVSQPGWLAVTAIPLIGTAAVCAIARYEYLHYTGSPELFSVSVTIFLLIVAIFILFHGLLEYVRSSYEKELQLQQNEQQERYFSEVQVAAENIRGLKHDINNHLQVLGSFLEMGKVEQATDYIAQITDFVKQNDIAVRSGNALIDAVLGSKLAKAIRLGIDVDYSIDIAGPIEMDMMLISAMLGNLLDNAIEACRKIHSVETDRYIFLAIALHEGMLHVAVKNARELAADTPDAPAKKPEKGRGIGLMNVRRAVEQFHGSMSIQETPGEYSVKIQVPYHSD